jgi:hypothetical protein
VDLAYPVERYAVALPVRVEHLKGEILVSLQKLHRLEDTVMTSLLTRS